ncbi:DUF4350 domain-containing protein [Maribacter chungangensis]|uniref:DUF4350 domain-containing protein n=1 Tax=Maribacter chungangensis TaxID=1069117 RepID=A0ABW3B2G0_9FLAO
MGKKGTIYLGIAILTLAAFMLLQYSKPKEINWFPSYVASHKIPYGTVVLNTVMEGLFPSQLQQVYNPPFEFINQNDSINGSYVFINNDIQFNKEELNALLNWTAKGNRLFIASKDFEEELKDTLGLETDFSYVGFETSQKQLHSLLNPRLTLTDSIIFNRDTSTPYFNKIDTLNTTVLGQVAVVVDKKQKELQVNALMHPFGDGTIILSTFPEAFTNYFILKRENKAYTAGMLSYLDDGKPIYLDNHYKSGKSFYTSPMYIFLNTKELKWAYYIALFGALLYVIFEGKRKQRAIPVVTPLPNRTLDFTRTISDMYYLKSDQKSIAEHKINYFLDWLRTRFYIGNIRKEDDFYNTIASRSGHSFEFVTKVFSFMEHLRNSDQISDDDLLKLNTLLQKFKAKTDGK